jgi:hypothetical protein
MATGIVQVVSAALLTEKVTEPVFKPLGRPAALMTILYEATVVGLALEVNVIQLVVVVAVTGCELPSLA